MNKKNILDQIEGMELLLSAVTRQLDDIREYIEDYCCDTRHKVGLSIGFCPVCAKTYSKVNEDE